LRQQRSVSKCAGILSGRNACSRRCRLKTAFLAPGLVRSPPPWIAAFMRQQCSVTKRTGTLSGRNTHARRCRVKTEL
jgi:hypothetical protein